MGHSHAIHLSHNMTHRNLHPLELKLQYDVINCRLREGEYPRCRWKNLREHSRTGQVFHIKIYEILPSPAAYQQTLQVATSKYHYRSMGVNTATEFEIPHCPHILRGGTLRLAPWYSGVASESMGGVYRRNAMGWNPITSHLLWRGQNEVGGELHHLTCSPWCDGDMGLCHTLIRVHTVWIKQNKYKAGTFPYYEPQLGERIPYIVLKGDHPQQNFPMKQIVPHGSIESPEDHIEPGMGRLHKLQYTVHLIYNPNFMPVM